jgi:hypothetical protein
LVRVPGVPFPLAPSSVEQWRIDEATGTVTVSAQPHTDIFIDLVTARSGQARTSR